MLRPIALSLLAATVVAQAPSELTQVLDASQFVFDTARQRIVVPLASGVWEYDGASWALMPGHPPESGRLVYDDSQGLAFLASSGIHAYDGHSFVPRAGFRPSAPSRVVADTQRSVLVAVNGTPGAVEEWNGTQWGAVAVLPTGPTRIYFDAAYDPLRGVTVFSDLAIGGTPTIRTETWEWDGTSLVGPSTVPSAQVNGLIAFDPGLGQIVAFRSTGVFGWTGGVWSQVSAVPLPASVSMVTTDRSNGRVLGMGSLGARRDAVYQWRNGSWSPVCALPHPEMTNGIVAYDEARDALFAFGRGVSQQVVVAEWNDRSWTPLPLPGSTTRSLPETPVYDAARGEIVVFGGQDLVAGLLGDTWAWNGTSWRLAASTGPSPRMGGALTYDPLRARVILVGGANSTSSLSDHWEWDGATWTQIFATTPMGGIAGVVGVDRLRNRVLFADGLGIAHEYDGTTWNFIGLTGAEPLSTLVWDPTRQRLVATMLKNGLISRHEWTGTAWQPIAGRNGQLAYDAARSRMLVLDDISLHVEAATPADRTDVGAGCGGSAVLSTLTPFGLPRVGNSAFHLDVRADAPVRPLALALGFGTANIQLGQGCALYLQSPFTSIIWFTDAHGFAQVALPLPSSLALRGVQLVGQAGVLEPSAPLGFVVTQGLLLTIGD
ncbi:MAG: hypothetical protein U1E73_12900 [Planctomycetota bacterium]